MSLEVLRLRRRPERVEAVRVTADNLAEVAEWCGGVVVDRQYRPGKCVRYMNANGLACEATPGGVLYHGKIEARWDGRDEWWWDSRSTLDRYEPDGPRTVSTVDELRALAEAVRVSGRMAVLVDRGGDLWKIECPEGAREASLVWCEPPCTFYVYVTGDAVEEDEMTATVERVGPFRVLDAPEEA